MSLVTLHTEKVGGVSSVRKVALNTSYITQLEEADGKAHFDFVFGSRTERYVVSEPEHIILNAPHESTNVDIPMTTTSGVLIVSTGDVLNIWPHPSGDRVWLRYLEGGKEESVVARYRFEEFIDLVNTESLMSGNNLSDVGSRQLSLNNLTGVGSEDDVLTITNGNAVWEAAAGGGAGDLVSTNNLSDVDDTETSLDNLGGIGEYMVPVWAEENSSLSANAYEWAFGNGANSPADGGLTVYVPSGWECHVVAMSLRIGSGTATVQLVHNGTSKGNDCNVAIAAGQGNTNEVTPLQINNNDYINFRTQAASGTSAPCVVTAWLRYRKT